MSFLDDIGNFLRQRIANPVGADLSHLGGALYNVANTAGKDIGNIASGVGTIAHNAGTGLVNTFENPNSGLNRFSNIVNSNLYDKPYSLITHPAFQAITGKNYNQVYPSVKPQGAFENALNLGTNFAGETAPFLAGEGEADLVTSIPKVAEFAAEHPKLAATGLNIGKNVLGGMTQAGLQEAPNAKQYAKNLLIQGAGSAPFGIGGEFANPLLRAGQGAVQGVGSIGIMNALSGGKLQPQDLIQAGVPAAMALIGGKGNDEAALKAYLDQHPEVVDKLKNHPAVKAVSQLANDNSGTLRPRAFFNKGYLENPETYQGSRFADPKRPNRLLNQMQFEANATPEIQKLKRQNQLSQQKLRDVFPEGSQIVPPSPEVVRPTLKNRLDQIRKIDPITEGNANNLREQNKILEATSINPGAFLGDQPIRDGKITLRGKPMTINDATLHGGMNPPEPPKGTPEQSTTGANQEPAIGELLRRNPFEKGKIDLGRSMSTTTPATDSDKAFITAQTGGRINEINEFGNQLAKKIEQILPSVEDQNAALYGHERNMISDKELQQYLDGTHPEYQKYYQELVSRGEDPIRAQEKVQKAITTMNKLLPNIQKGRSQVPQIKQAISYLQKAGFEPALEHAHSIGLLPNEVGIKDYLPNFVSLSEEERNLPNSSGISSTFSNAMKRTRNNVFENIAHGETPHTNLPDMVRRYFNGYGKATAFRELEGELTRTKGAGWIPLQNLDKNTWSQLGNEHYDQTKVMTNPATGKLENVTERYIYAGPKEVIDLINKAFVSTPNDKSTFSGKVASGYDWAVQALRYQQLSDSIYHIHNIGSAAIYEGLKGNPLSTIKYLKDSFTPEQRQEAARWGYTMQKQDYRRMEANQKKALDPQGLEASVGKILSKPGQAYTKVADAISSLIFDHIQEPAAMIAYAKDKSSFITKFQKDHGGQMPSQVELDRHMLQKGKAAAGLLGEYQQEIRGASRELQKKLFARILISSNYTRSKVGLLKDATLGEGIGGFKGAGSNEARKGLIAQAIMGTIGTTLMSLAISGKLASPSKYNITAPITNVNFGVGPDGKERQGNIFWGGVLGDIVSALNNASNDGPIGGVLKEANNKLIPALGDVQDIMNNKDYLGKSITTPGAPLPQQLGEEVKYLTGPQGGLWPVPFTATNLISQINANTNPASTKKYSPEEIGYTALTGQTLSHVTPSSGSTGDLSGFPSQFNQTNEGKTGYNDTQAAALANTNQNYAPYIKGVTEVFKDGSGKAIPTFADKLAGYMYFNGGFQGGSKNTRETAQKLQAAYMKTGNWEDALNSLGAKNVNSILNYKMNSGEVLNSNANPQYASNIYDKNYVDNAIKGTANLTNDNWGSLVDQAASLVRSPTTGKVNANDIKGLLQQYANTGAFGDWNPAMDQKLSAFQSATGDKISSDGVDIIKKQIRAETQYDPKNAWMIDYLIQNDIANYKKTGNWQDAIAMTRGLDPNSQQGEQYFNIVDSSATVPKGGDRQNWLTFQTQTNFSGTKILTPQDIGLEGLQQQSGDNAQAPAIQANTATQTPKSQWTNISNNVPYASMINSAATKYGVPASVIAAVIQQESGFNPQAVGDNGSSFGLRQYNLPSHPNLTVQQAEDPSYAIDTLARDIASNIKSAGGNWALAATQAQNPADHAGYYSSISSLMNQFGGGTFAGSTSGGGSSDLASLLNSGMSLSDAIDAYNSGVTSSNKTDKSLASDTAKYFAAQTKLEKPNMFKLKGTTKATGLQANAALATGTPTKEAKFAKITLPNGKSLEVKGGLAKLSTTELKRIISAAQKRPNPVRYKPYIKAVPLKLSEQTVRK